MNAPTRAAGDPGRRLPDTRTAKLMRTPPALSLRGEIAGTCGFGLAILLLFFVVGGLWAAYAPLAGAAIAPGVVSPASSRQTVQHLEGGIIREIRVRNGDAVVAGDVLVVLEPIGIQAAAGAKLSRLRRLAATEARLTAERSGAARVVFEHPVLRGTWDEETRAATEAQVHQLRTRRANDASRKAILEQRIAQLEQQVVGFTRQLQGVRRQYALIGEEVAGVRQLYEKGLERKPRLLALQRAEAELLSRQGELTARIARAGEAIGETRLQIANLAIRRREEVDAELAQVQSERLAVEEEMRSLTDRLERTAIRAPADGDVLDLRFTTVGGVVRPGEAILDLVPANDDLVIEARVRPVDIDEVRVGQAASVVFPSFSRRNMRRVEGVVDRVGADVLFDELAEESYYQARIVIDAVELHDASPDVELSPGMPAEVYIATSERTLLGYLLQPMLRAVERAMRES